MEDCGRPMRQTSSGVLLCLARSSRFALAASSGTSAAVGVTFTVDSAADAPDTTSATASARPLRARARSARRYRNPTQASGSKDTIAFDLTTPPFSDFTCHGAACDHRSSRHRRDDAAGLRRQADRRAPRRRDRRTGSRGLRLRRRRQLPCAGSSSTASDIDMISIERPAGDGDPHRRQLPRHRHHRLRRRRRRTSGIHI